VPDLQERFTIPLSAYFVGSTGLTCNKCSRMGKFGRQAVRAGNVDFISEQGVFSKTNGRTKICDISRFREISREGSGFSGALDIQLLNPRPESARIDSKNGGGAVFSLDLPTGSFEDLEDMVPLQFRKRFERPLA